MSTDQETKQDAASVMESLLGPKLLNVDGEELATASSLANKKTVILYFSAHWCPPCRKFTPMLSKAYKDYAERCGDDNDKKETELVFCSWDQSIKSFEEYHQKEMSFPAIPFSREMGQQLGEKYGVEGIPSLVAIDPQTGDVLYKEVDLRKLVDQHGSAVFPLTAEKIEGLNAEAKLKSKAKLEELLNGTVACMVKREEDDAKEVALSTVFQDYEYVGLVLGDGDFEDKSYPKMLETTKQVNDEHGANHFAMVYLGASLYNDSCDHTKASKGFSFRNLEASEELKSAMNDIANGELSLTMLLRRGKGLCNIDGTCEEDGVLYLVGKPRATTAGMFEAGAKSFPWDAKTMAAFEDAKKKRIESTQARLANFEIFKGENDKPLLLRGDKSVDIKDVLESLGGADDEEAVVGLYFSAHWCPPCQMFTPEFVKAWGELKAAGKKCEIIFVSSDQSKEEFEGYYNEMKTGDDDQFLALSYDERDLKNDLSQVLEVGGIPTLVFFKPDATIITKNGTEAVSMGAVDCFPFDEESLKRGQKAAEEREAAENAAKLTKEKEAAEKAKADGHVVVERLRGTPGSVQVDYSEKTIEFLGSFSTALATELLTKTGVMYYELEIVERGGLGQFGFALEGGMEAIDGFTSGGTGDNDKSWAVDGTRGAKWHADASSPWPFVWEVGTVVGLAVNIESGMIAASNNGEWSGVTFQNETIKTGVCPSMTADDFKVRYAFSDFKYGPPPESVWTA